MVAGFGSSGLLYGGSIPLLSTWDDFGGYCLGLRMTDAGVTSDRIAADCLNPGYGIDPRYYSLN